MGYFNPFTGTEVQCSTKPIAFLYDRPTGTSRPIHDLKNVSGFNDGNFYAYELNEAKVPKQPIPPKQGVFQRYRGLFLAIGGIACTVIGALASAWVIHWVGPPKDNLEGAPTADGTITITSKSAKEKGLNHSEPKYLVLEAPAHKKSQKELYYQFPNPGYDDGRTSFKMTGRGDCSYGFTWSTNGSDNYSIHRLNGKYNTIKGTLGHVDPLAKAATDFDILLRYPGETTFSPYRTYGLHGNMDPVDIEVDVTGADEIMFVLRATNASVNYTGYGLCDVTIE